jgi:hypothetical protein
MRTFAGPQLGETGGKGDGEVGAALHVAWPGGGPWVWTTMGL